MILNAVIKGSGGGDDGLVKFSYTGSCVIDGNILRLLDSGAFTLLSSDVLVDLFLVGGGGGGGNGNYYESNAGNRSYNGGGGGGGGYTHTQASVLLSKGITCDAVVGAGGAPASGGGSTSILTFTANGGSGGTTPTADITGGNGSGGSGGSGGGSGGSVYYDVDDDGYTSRYGLGGPGGVDGADGYYRPSAMGAPTIPTGQGTTTRAFGDTSGELFSTGGDGGAQNISDRYRNGTDGVANTGDGGGGGVGNGYSGGKGGSGIILIRFPEGTKLALSLPAIGTPLEQWTWEQIVFLANSGVDVTQYFAVGDQKNLVLTTGEVVPVVIGDFNRNTITNSNGKKAPIAFTFKNCLNTTYPMNASDTNSGSWDGSDMRKTHMVNIFNTFPAELRADGAVKYVDVVATAGNQSTTLKTSSDRLRLHSITELGLTYSNAGTEGTKYAYYASGNRVKTVGGNKNYYWTRSPHVNSSRNFCNIGTSGAALNYSADSAYGVACGFDI